LTDKRTTKANGGLMRFRKNIFAAAIELQTGSEL